MRADTCRSKFPSLRSYGLNGSVEDWFSSTDQPEDWNQWILDAGSIPAGSNKQVEGNEHDVNMC